MSWFFWWGLSEFGMALDKYYYVGVCETWSFVSDIFCDYMGLMPFSFGEVDVFLKKKKHLGIHGGNPWDVQAFCSKLWTWLKFKEGATPLQGGPIDDAIPSGSFLTNVNYPPEKKTCFTGSNGTKRNRS